MECDSPVDARVALGGIDVAAKVSKDSVPGQSERYIGGFKHLASGKTLLADGVTKHGSFRF